MFSLLSCLVNSYGVIRRKEKHIASCCLWLVGTCVYEPLQCYRIDSRLLIWNACASDTSVIESTSFLQLCFTDRDAKKWQGSSLFNSMFLEMPTLKSSVPELQVKLWKIYMKITLIWSVNENNRIVSWLLVITQMDNFFKLEIHLSVKIYFYEEEVDTSLKQRSMWLTVTN